MIPNSLPNPESLVGKRVHARSPDDDSPTNKKIKLHKQAYDLVLYAFNAESPALSHVNISFLSMILRFVCALMSCLLPSVKDFDHATPPGRMQQQSSYQ